MQVDLSDCCTWANTFSFTHTVSFMCSYNIHLRWHGWQRGMGFGIIKGQSAAVCSLSAPTTLLLPSILSSFLHSCSPPLFSHLPMSQMLPLPSALWPLTLTVCLAICVWVLIWPGLCQLKHFFFSFGHTFANVCSGNFLTSNDWQLLEKLQPPPWLPNGPQASTSLLCLSQQMEQLVPAGRFVAWNNPNL